MEENLDLNHAAVDPYAGMSSLSPPDLWTQFEHPGIFFSKDRQEETIEVEELPEMAFVRGQKVPVMTQGEFMKGCPEGGEQGFLFSLYMRLTGGTCPCPKGCGWAYERLKPDFFAVFVCPTTSLRFFRLTHCYVSPISQNMLNIFVRWSNNIVQHAATNSVPVAGKVIASGMLDRRTSDLIRSSTARIFKVLSLAWGST
jgi:hypothetical protein